MCITVPMAQGGMVETPQEEEMKVILAGVQQEMVASSQIEEEEMANILRMGVGAQPQEVVMGVVAVMIGGVTVMVVGPVHLMVLCVAGPGVILQG